MTINLKLPLQILHPDRYLTPTIHMSPFSGKLDYKLSNRVSNNWEVLAMTSQVLLGENYSASLTMSGREAIAQALKKIVKTPDFLISILTPSNSGYVSSCVTSEISKCCRYIFGDSVEADAYFIIHEFGRPMYPPAKVLNSGKPVIEDCAYACVAPIFGGGYGLRGEYIIYSLPKAFDVQYGGILFSKNAELNDICIPSNHDSYLIGKLENFIKNIEKLNKKRLDVYFEMQKISRAYNFEELLPYYGDGVPHSFIIKIDGNIDHNSLKSYMNNQGVESSVFYGGGGYFLPCHQNLTTAEIEYIFYHLNFFATC